MVGVPQGILHHRRRAVTHARGFTLVELLVAVAIIGILAVLALYGYRKYVDSAQATEAQAVMQGIRAGQEAYKAETLGYLGCSGCGGVPCAPNVGSLQTYYPQTTVGAGKASWVNNGHADYACWRMLNVVTDGPVRFGYAVIAGNPGQLPAPATSLVPAPVWPASMADNPWYVIEAAGDRNGDGKKAIFVGTSITGEILRQDEFE
jgi:type IV pilus assembly protein PilA